MRYVVIDNVRKLYGLGVNFDDLYHHIVVVGGRNVDDICLYNCFINGDKFGIVFRCVGFLDGRFHYKVIDMFEY